MTDISILHAGPGSGLNIQNQPQSFAYDAGYLPMGSGISENARAGLPGGSEFYIYVRPGYFMNIFCINLRENDMPVSGRVNWCGLRGQSPNVAEFNSSMTFQSRGFSVRNSIDMNSAMTEGYFVCVSSGPNVQRRASKIIVDNRELYSFIVADGYKSKNSPNGSLYWGIYFCKDQVFFNSTWVDRGMVTGQSGQPQPFDTHI